MVFTGLVASSIAPATALTFDPGLQFDSTNNPATANGWSYGYEAGIGGPFSLLPSNAVAHPQFDGWQYSNANPYPDISKNVSDSDYVLPASGGFIPKGSLSISPGQGATAGIVPVLRWTVPEAGVYSITTTFTGAWDQPDSLGTVYIVFNEASIFSDSIFRHSSVSFSGTLTLAVGDHLDFSVSPAVNNSFVRAIVASSISPVPESATQLYFLAGLLGLGILASGRKQQPRRWL
jgi:hypothetical protein